jgi:thymidylate synthase
MRTFEFESVEESYQTLVKTLLEEGNEVSPRGQLTKEISPAAITITNPLKNVISHPVRDLNYGFMVGELLWILEGKNNLDITHYNSVWGNFTDDGETLNGAYGQRIFKWNGYDVDTDKKVIIDQFELAYQQLKKDPQTRQASIVLFNPARDYKSTKDKPCTNLLRFTIRDGKLNMLTMMRSNDIWWGYPYDVFNFTMLQAIMASKLGIEVGKYTHIADSLHIYERHFEIGEEMVNTKNNNIYESTKDTNIDGRIMENDVNSELNKVFDVESVTRLASDDITVDLVKMLLDKINNNYWKSLASLIASYNFKKANRSKLDINYLKENIENEFSEIF